MTDQLRQTVLNLLDKLSTDKLDALKQLFWSELNYDRENAPVSIRNWPSELKQLIAEPPLLFASAGKDGDFKIVYCRLRTNMRQTEERLIINRLINHYGLFILTIFSDVDYSCWHFVNIKHQREEDDITRRVLRRISVQPGKGLRTAAERLSLLDVGITPITNSSLSAIEIQNLHNEAFDVESVTRDFFKCYREIFQKVEASLPLSGRITEVKRRLFTQRFFNRLMFLMFLEHKGWLSLNGNREYLRTLMVDYIQNEKDKLGGYGFHRSRLNVLFFNTLNNKESRNRIIDPDYSELRRKVGDAPYLNGGLFDEEEGDNEWLFPDKVIILILTDLLYAFNFTVTESTPFDIEVAVDPEMLGKIFEELVTGRHETGSYYTPKPVVSFMCRQALKGYLQRSCPSETMPALDQFVEKRNPSGLINPESILRVLREIKVCDPACGSGAYLLGMLHELLDLRAALFSIHQLDARTIYDRKLEIIQKNLYGVDKDSFTVNIARLRLWLSLVVDDPRNPLEQPDLDVALPNLDFKIESGDSLTAPDPTDGLANLSADFIKQFQNAKDLFGFTHGSNKRNLYQDVIDIKTKIQAWSGRTANNDEFDWRVEFAEIYSNEDSSKRGFDVVLANPPYVRADAQFRHIEDEQERQVEIVKWKGYREQLIGTKTYKTFYEKWDLYIPFLERAFQLLRQDGQMVFIIPDAYNSAKYAKKSHEFFLQLSRIERIDFCSEINLFSAGVNNTILHFTKERASADHCPVRMRRWGKNKEEFEDNFEILSTYNQATGKEMIFRNNYATYQDCNRKNDTQNYDFIPLTQIVYISYGLRANADDSEWRGEFKTEDCISSVMDEKHPKKFLQGKNIEKWKNSSMQYLEWGTERAPSKFARPTFKQLYDVPEKLIATKVSLKPKVAYDSEQYIHSDGGISFVPWHYLSGIVNRSIKKTSQYSHQFPEGDRKSRESISQQFNLKYILGILNSEYAISLLAQHRRNKLQLYPDDWKQFPIALITMDEQMEFVKLVDEILAVFEQHGYPLAMEQERHVFELERRLDKMVTNLYEK